jgi:hypothetical protein
MIDIDSIQVVFGLPEWTSDERFDKETVIRYSGGHAWAGQPKGYQNENTISNGLFEIEVPDCKAEVTETCLDPMGQSVTVAFSCNLGDFPTQVGLFQRQLRQFLRKIRSQMK